MYCIDTSVWIDAWRDYYPPDVFGSLWERMDHLVRAGKVIAPVEVLLELERREDGIYKWLKEREFIFFEPHMSSHWQK